MSDRLSSRGCPPTARLSSRGVPPSSGLKKQELKMVIKTKRPEKQQVESHVEAEASESEHSEEDEEAMDTKPDVDGKAQKKKRRKRKGRFTDFNSTKAKKRAERREKVIAEQKEETGNEDVEQKDTDEEKNFKEQEEEEDKTISFRSYCPFQLLCDNILRKFMAKDPEEYFALPVSTKDAPDYGSIIANPMDFSTIRTKIADNLYNHIDELKKDINLICDNAMTYNQINTVYYMAAQKLATLSSYYFSSQYQTYLRHALPFGKDVPFEMMDLSTHPKPKEHAEKPASKKPNPMRAAIVDNMTPMQIIKSVNKHTKERLSSRVPQSHLAFIDNKDGATTLNIVTSAEKPTIPLGDLLDRLEKGTPGIMMPYEPRLSAQVPITYTSYGPFSSFAPQYDSTWATLNKRDSDLLIACYGDRSNASNAIALRHMVEDSGENLLRAVDGILDALTDGEHTRTINALSNPPVESDKNKETKHLTTEDFRELLDEVATLQNVGLDMSFIESFKADLGIPSRAPTYGARLEKTGAMLQDLVSLQTVRLNAQPPPTLTEAVGASQIEVQLAGKVVTELQSQINQCGVKPADVTTEVNIHQAIGLNNDDYDILTEFLIV